MTSPKMDDRLLPCPFCGSDAVRLTIDQGVQCENCGSNAFSAAHWNMRNGSLVIAAESALAAVWDAHYGKGISVEYARAIDSEVKAALGRNKDGR